MSVKTPDFKETLDNLKGKTTGQLPTEAEETIRATALAESIAEEKAEAKKAAEERGEVWKDPDGDQEPEKKADVTDDQKPPADKAKTGDLTDEEKVKAEKEKADAEAKAAKEKADAAQVETDAAILAKKDEELTPDEKTRKGEITKASEAAFEDEAKLYAAAEKITVEEAREALKAEQNIITKYGAEPKKLARAYHHSQREYKRLESSVKAEREAAANVLTENEIVMGDKKLTFDEAKPAMIAAYRERFPEKMADLSDDQVFETAKKEYREKVKEVTAAHKAQIKTEADSKRAKILLGLPESTKPYQDLIKEVLGQAPDHRVVQDDYDPEDLIHWARGQHFTPDRIKELEDAAFKRGQEKAKILGEKGGGSPERGGGAPGAGAGDSNAEIGLLTQEQKDRALNMFESIQVWDDKRKFVEYIDHLKQVGEWHPKK